jgi:hypothetical protein
MTSLCSAKLPAHRLDVPLVSGAASPVPDGASLLDMVLGFCWTADRATATDPQGARQSVSCVLEGNPG